MGPLVLDKQGKYDDPSLNHSREIPPETTSDTAFSTVFLYNFRTKVDNDVISGIAVSSENDSVINVSSLA